MEKVKITREQADKIKGWEWHTKYPSILLKIHGYNSFVCNNCLQDLTLDELARALYVGYEVEEFEHWDWVYILETGEIGRVDRNYSGIGFVDVYNHNYHTKGYKPNEIHHAAEHEIVEEKERVLDKKIDEMLLGLESHERTRLREKLECGDY